ncbi:transposable element Tcb1 transposase [Trichonephila clavipes]|nr:transposable element Tcb1 transposase [Trichonephila clavipes]
MAPRSHFSTRKCSTSHGKGQDYLRTVTTLLWPALSPDLSPIEHIWNHLGWRVGHPTSLNELEARLQQIWKEMSQDIIQNLHASVPDHISCIRARRVSTGCQVIYSQFGLAIHQNDHQARRRFIEWDQNEIAVVPDFNKRILFSDEKLFWLNGYVNKQNCHIWSEANPQVYLETPLHPEKLTVWCALWAGGIIGPYFFKNDEGHNVTVNVDRYRAMITNFFIPELNNHDVQELWFQ